MKSVPCFSCGIDLYPSFPDSDDMIIEHQPFNDGTTQMLSFHYGSKLDGNVYFMGVCDDCACKALEEGRLTYSHNFITDEKNG